MTLFCKSDRDAAQAAKEIVSSGFDDIIGDQDVYTPEQFLVYLLILYFMEVEETNQIRCRELLKLCRKIYDSKDPVETIARIFNNEKTSSETRQKVVNFCNSCHNKLHDVARKTVYFLLMKD